MSSFLNIGKVTFLEGQTLRFFLNFWLLICRYIRCPFALTFGISVIYFSTSHPLPSKFLQPATWWRHLSHLRPCDSWRREQHHTLPRHSLATWHHDCPPCLSKVAPLIYVAKVNRLQTFYLYSTGIASHLHHNIITLKSFTERDKSMTRVHLQ